MVGFTEKLSLVSWGKRAVVRKKGNDFKLGDIFKIDEKNL